MNDTQQTKIAIVRKMFFRKCIGGKHTSPEYILKNIKGKDPKKSLNELIKANIILSHPTHYGQQITLNQKKIKEIKELLSND